MDTQLPQVRLESNKMFDDGYGPEPSKNLRIIGIVVSAAVLLAAVASVGCLLMSEGGMTDRSYTMSIVAAFAFVCFVAALVDGRQRRTPARTVSTSLPAPMMIPAHQPVQQEARFVDRLVGIDEPLGDKLADVPVR